jgi:hypothetical protein
VVSEDSSSELYLREGKSKWGQKIEELYLREGQSKWVQKIVFLSCI